MRQDEVLVGRSQLLQPALGRGRGSVDGELLAVQELRRRPVRTARHPLAGIGELRTEAEKAGRIWDFRNAKFFRYQDLSRHFVINL